MYYAENNFAEITADNRSLVIAFANLLKRYDMEHDPIVLDKLLTQDDNRLDWWSLLVYFKDIEVTDMSEGGKPTNSPSIVRYRRMDDSAAGPVDHYCLMADVGVGSIIDSLDGVIKSGREYGEILGYASYGLKVGNMPDQDEFLEINDRSYTVLRGETLWSIAAKFKIDAEELLFYNSLTSPKQVEAGMEIHLPITDSPAVEENTMRYEIHSPVKQMHISRPEGAYKWSFGNANRITDITKSGPTWSYNAPVDVAATAHVPLQDGIAHYYMTPSDVGQYAETGRVNYSIGFNHTHLADGPPVEIKAPEPEPIVTPEAVIEDVKYMSKMEDPNAYKISWHKFRETGIYRVKNSVWVKEYDGRQPDHFLSEGEKVELVGTFMRPGNDTVYGRPWSSTNHFWFGIPMNCLEPVNEDEDIDELGNQPVAEKIASRRAHVASPVMRPSEKVFDIFSYVATRPLALSEDLKKRYIKRKDTR